MIPLHLNSESGLPYPWFAAAVMRDADLRFLNFVSGNFDSITGTTANEKLGNLLSAHKQNLIDGGDNWYRTEVASFGTADATEPAAFTAFFLDLVSGNTADEQTLIVQGDELGGSPDFQPELGDTDPLTHPIELLALHISRTATFRTWCGLAADDPKASVKLLEGRNFPRRIYRPAFYQSLVHVPSLLPKLPICVISPPETGGLAMTKATDDDAYDHSGSIDVTILDRSRAGLDLEKAARQFMRRLGFLLQELQRVDHANDRLGIEDETVGMSHGEPTPAEIATQGITFEGRFQVGWSG